MSNLTFKFFRPEDDFEEILLIETENGETTEEHDALLESLGIYQLSDGNYEFTLNKEVTKNLLIKNKFPSFVEVE